MTVLYATLFFMFGTLAASFAGVLADRLPEHRSLRGRSQCDACGHQLRLIDVFPLIGFAVNRGKCRFCGAKILLGHLLAEAAGGILFALSYLLVGWTTELAAALLMVFVLMIEARADVKGNVVLDPVWIVGIVPVAFIRILQGSILEHLLSAVVLFGIMYLIALVGRTVMNREALGGGDVKLYLFIGFCLTWDTGLLSLFIASLAGAAYGFLRKSRGSREYPFVPFIFLGVLVAYYWGSDLIAWYLRLLGA